MQRKRIYLDTSVISLQFQEEAGERRDVTRDFFKNIVETRIHEVFISSVVIDEIDRTKDLVRRNAMRDTIAQHNLPLLAYDAENEEIELLADRYIALGIIPPAKRRDALHVAIATVHEIDVLLTWNFRHLAGLEREAIFASANKSEGFIRPLKLLTPMEVAYP